MGDDGLAGVAAQVGHGGVGEHGDHLLGRAGEHDDQLALPLHGETRRGALVVLEHGAAFGHLRLLAGIGGQLDAALGVVAGDALHGLLVAHHLRAEVGRYRLLGHVVKGGAKAAGGDDQVSSVKGVVEGLFQPLRVVPHHRLVVQVDAHGGQLLGDVRRVGVDDVAQQQLRAHAQNLSGHSAVSFPNFWMISRMVSTQATAQVGIRATFIIRGLGGIVHGTGRKFQGAFP